MSEQQLRHDLSAAHWLTHRFGMDSLTWNHISARCGSTFLVTPGRSMWDEIEPKDLVASSGNVTANIIHSAIYEARPDIHAIVHLHTPAALAVSCLQGGLECFDQDSANFVGDAIAYHDWEGVSDGAAESEHISVSIGSKATTLFHRNHGATCCGATVG